MLFYIEINRDIKGSKKNQKYAWYFLRLPFSLLKFSDENNTAKIGGSDERKFFQQTFLNFNTFSHFSVSLIFSTICKQFAQLPVIKISLQNFKPHFPVILQIFDLECHAQVFLKLLLSSFATSSWNLENWKASTWKSKTQSP